MLTPSGHTRVAAVIGEPVRHSLSPTLHNAAFSAAGLDWVYVAFSVADGRAAAALDAVRTLGIDGLSVTMPHKATVAEAVDELTPAAAALGAVNCVVNRGGRLHGDNTDGAGFLDGLADDAGIDVSGRRVAVIGAGGAARAVVVAAADAGAAEIVVVNRSPDAAARAAALAPGCGRVGERADIRSADLVVNATPIGMHGDAQPVPAALVDPGQVAVDLIYAPAETAWLAALRARGVAAHNGLSMLVHQAARAFEIWTGEPAPLAAMRSAVGETLDRRPADNPREH